MTNNFCFFLFRERANFFDPLQRFASSGRNNVAAWWRSSRHSALRLKVSSNGIICRAQQGSRGLIAGCDWPRSQRNMWIVWGKVDTFRIRIEKRKSQKLYVSEMLF